MGRCTQRDLHCYEMMLKSRLIFNVNQLARIFYNQSSNVSSAETICARRLKILEAGQYVFKVNQRAFGKAQLWSAVKQNTNQQNHKLLMSEFWATLCSNGFQVLDIETEKPLLNGELRCDMFLTVRYGDNPPFYVIVECDLTKDFNAVGYERLIQSIQTGETRFDKKLLIVSICDRPIQSDVKRYVIQLKRDLSDFAKFQYQFIK